MANDPQDFLVDITAFIDEVTQAADEAVERLESIASVPFQTWQGFAPSESVELAKAPTLVAEDSFPSLEKVSFDTSIGEFDPNAYRANVYDSTFFTFLEPYLTEQIELGGPGISDTVQDALFDNQRERDLQILADATNAIRVTYSRTGFPLPTQVLRGQENEVIKKYQDDRSNRNREITVLIAERAADFVKTAISSGSSMEETRMRFALGFAGLFNDTTTALISRFKAEQDARVVEFRGQLDIILAKLGVGKTNAEIDLNFQAQILKQFEIESSQSIERTKSLIAQGEQTTQVKLEAAKALASYYSTLAGSSASSLLGVSGNMTTTTISEG